RTGSSSLRPIERNWRSTWYRAMRSSRSCKKSIKRQRPSRWRWRTWSTAKLALRGEPKGEEALISLKRMEDFAMCFCGCRRARRDEEPEVHETVRSSPRFGRASSVKPAPGKRHMNIDQGGRDQLDLTHRANARSIMISVAGWKITLLPKTWP